MSPSEPAAAAPRPVLDLLERRVLGVLVEKQKTSKTADTYPMTVNALVTGCNQKSNRDPVLNLSEEAVNEVLLRCQKKGLAIRITGSRVERWRHALYEVWNVDKVELAVLAELLLRGPQTEGELRTRASRMEPIDDLDALRNILKPMVQRHFVVYLTPEERRGAMLTHGFHDPHELEQLRSRAVPAPEPIPSIPATAAVAMPPADAQNLSKLETAVCELREENAALKKQMTELRAIVEKLEAEVQALKQSLGG